MYVSIWSYRVKPQHTQLFVEHYKADGTWAALFRQSPEYISTELLLHDSDPAVFITIDRWQSKAAYEFFMKHNEATYKALDERCEVFTEAENQVGQFILCP